MMTNEENKQAFKTRVLGSVRQLCAETTARSGMIGYNEGKSIVSRIEMLFCRFLDYCPKQVDAVNSLALAFIAPSMREKTRLIRRVASMSAGIAGLAAIIAGIGMAVGWGAGIIAAVIAWFTGTSLAGPIGWIAGGVTLTVIAAYFHFRSDDAISAERFEMCLVGGLDKAIDEVWDSKGCCISDKLAQIPIF